MKQKHFTLSARQISFLFGLLYVLCLIPPLLISFYDVPSSDDFSMALESTLAFRESGSVAAAFAAAVQKTITLYQTWTGYFTSSLFTTISPASFGPNWYFLAPLIVFAGLHLGVILFCRVLFCRILRVDPDITRCVTLAVLFLMIQMMPEGEARVEAFYWYSGAGNYTLTFSLMLVYFTCLLLSVWGRGKKSRALFLILAAILGFFAGGSNYMSALTGAIVTFLFLILLVLVKTGQMEKWLLKEDACKDHLFLTGSFRLSQILPVLTFFAGFLCNCLAPGNTIRSEQTEGFGAVKSIVISLYYALEYPLGEWLTFALALILLLLAILFWKSHESAVSPLTFRHPALIVVLGYGLTAANITPSLFATANIGAGRIQALFWMQYILLAVSCEWYVIGWLRRKMDQKAPARKTQDPEKSAALCRIFFSGAYLKTIGFLLFLLGVGSVLCIGVNPDYFTCTSALEDLANGSAKAYKEENDARFNYLLKTKEKDVTVTRCRYEPDLLYVLDVDVGDEGWANYVYGLYFEKDTVTGQAWEDAQ